MWKLELPYRPSTLVRHSIVEESGGVFCNACEKICLRNIKIWATLIIDPQLTRARLWPGLIQFILFGIILIHRQKIGHSQIYLIFTFISRAKVSTSIFYELDSVYGVYKHQHWTLSNNIQQPKSSIKSIMTFQRIIPYPLIKYFLFLPLPNWKERDFKISSELRRSEIRVLLTELAI